MGEGEHTIIGRIPRERLNQIASRKLSTLGVPVRIDFVDTPPGLRERYQYFTEARMERLRARGFSKEPITLEDGVARAIGRMQDAKS